MRELLKKHQIIPVATFVDEKQAQALVEGLFDQGIHIVEITLRTPYALDGIAFIKQTYGHLLTIGAGTVIHTKQIEQLRTLDVDFIVSPGLDECLVEACKSYAIPYLPGVVTPSEIIKGISLGMNTFKFFPATVFGGTSALKTYAQVFPDVQFCPTGGIDANTVDTYLDLPNVIAVGGSWMLK